MNLKTAVNAKTPRGKGARDREMSRKKQVYMTHPTGDGTQQPEPLCLCTFAHLRWFNCSFSSPEGMGCHAIGKGKGGLDGC